LYEIGKQLDIADAQGILKETVDSGSDPNTLNKFLSTYDGRTRDPVVQILTDKAAQTIEKVVQSGASEVPPPPLRGPVPKVRDIPPPVKKDVLPVAPRTPSEIEIPQSILNAEIKTVRPTGTAMSIVTGDEIELTVQYASPVDIMLHLVGGRAQKPFTRSRTKLERTALDTLKNMLPNTTEDELFAASREMPGVVDEAVSNAMATRSVPPGGVGISVSEQLRRTRVLTVNASETAGRLYSDDARRFNEKLQQVGLPTKDMSAAGIGIPGDIVPSTAPRSLVKEKPTYTIRNRVYSLEFESDIDKALFIVSPLQKTKSVRDASYMKWLKKELPGFSDPEIRAMGEGVDKHVELAVRGQPKGDVFIRRSREAVEVIPEDAVDKLITDAKPATPLGRPQTAVEKIRAADGELPYADEQFAMAEPLNIAKWVIEDISTLSAQIFARLGGKFPEHMRKMPGIVQRVVGAWEPAMTGWDTPAQKLSIEKNVWLEFQLGSARYRVMAWRDAATNILGFIKGKDNIWRATKVAATSKADKKSAAFQTLDDLLEKPELYSMTPEQQVVIQAGQDMQTVVLKRAQDVGVSISEIAVNYWHRIVLEGPKQMNLKNIRTFMKNMFRGKQRPKGMQGYRKPRTFKDVEDGTKYLETRGYVYETDPSARLLERLEAGLVTIAEAEVRQTLPKIYPEYTITHRTAETLKDLTAAVDIAGKEVQQARAALKANLGDPAATLELRRAMANSLLSLRAKKLRLAESTGPAAEAAAKEALGETSIPPHMIVPNDLGDEIKHFIPLSGESADAIIPQAIQDSFKLIRATLTTGDYAAGFLQGNLLFFRNNVAWWRAQAVALRATLKAPDSFVAKNFDQMHEGVMRGAIQPPTDFLFTGSGIASIPTSLPLVGGAFRTFQRWFEWFILAGQTELYKAATRKGGQSVEELVSLGRAIRMGLGTESYAILGVRPTQQTVEAVLAFAPRYFRANIGILAQSLTKGKGADEARKLVGSMFAGGFAWTVALHYLTTGKMVNVDDPYAPDWLSFPVGKTYHNVFGPFYPFMRAAARVSVTMLKVPAGTMTFDAAVKKSAKELTHAMMSKRGVPISVIGIFQQYLSTGQFQSFEGDIFPLTPEGVSRGIWETAGMISIREIIQGLKEGRPEAFLSLIGLAGRASPYAQMNILFEKNADINPKGVPYSKADAHQKAMMTELHPKLAADIIARGRGVWGEAGRQIEAISIEQYRQMESLEEGPDSLLGGEHWEAEKYIQEIRRIKDHFAGQKLGVYAALGLYQDEGPLPIDPNKRAVTQYYRGLGDARVTRVDAQGNKVASRTDIDWDKFEDILSGLQDTWTPEQNRYVDVETNEYHAPPRASQYREATIALKPYWNIGKNYAETVPNLTELDKASWNEFLTAPPLQHAFMRRRSDAIRYLEKKRKAERKAWMRDNPELGLAVVRWFKTLGETKEQNNLYNQLYPR